MSKPDPTQQPTHETPEQLAVRIAEAQNKIQDLISDRGALTADSAPAYWRQMAYVRRDLAGLFRRGAVRSADGSFAQLAGFAAGHYYDHLAIEYDRAGAQAETLANLRRDLDDFASDLPDADTAVLGRRCENNDDLTDGDTR